MLPDAMAVPIPGAMVTVVAPLVCHCSVVLSPAVIAAGLAVKSPITGSLSTVPGTAVMLGVAVFCAEGRGILIPPTVHEAAPPLRVTHPGTIEKTSARATPVNKNL